MTEKIKVILREQGSLTLDSIRYYLSYKYDLVQGREYSSDDFVYIIQGMLKDELIKNRGTHYTL